MTVQGKPDRCPNCGKSIAKGGHYMPPCMGDEGMWCCDQLNKLDSSPVPAAGNVSAPNPRQVVTDAIREQEPKPTQLLALLSSQLSYGEIQDILSELLELGTVELGSDRRLRMVLRERPVPAAAPTMMEGVEAERKKDEEVMAQWALGAYTGETCPNCGRVRICKCPNGKRRCEKCNWVIEEGRYLDTSAPQPAKYPFKRPSAPQAESVNEIWDIRHPAAESDQAAINRRMVDEHDSCVCTPGSPCKYHAESASRPRISDLVAAMDEGKHIDIQPDGKVFVSDHPPRPTIDVLLSQIEAESVPSTKNKSTPEGKDFWNHVEATAEHVRTSSEFKKHESVPSGTDAARECAVIILMDCAGKYVHPEGYSRAPQVVINEQVDRAVKYINRFAAELERSNSLLRERITAAEGLLKIISDPPHDCCGCEDHSKANADCCAYVNYHCPECFAGAYFEKENQ